MLKGSCVLSLRPVPIHTRKSLRGGIGIPTAKLQGCRIARLQSYLDIARAFQLVRIKVKCSWDERFVQGGQSEPEEEPLRRAEATQCLQGCDRLRSRRMAAHRNREPGFSLLRNSQL